ANAAEVGLKGVANVELQLDPNRLVESRAKREFVTHDAAGKIIGTSREMPKVVDDEPEPLRHLRSYSRYLTPRSGVFSLDTWALLSLYLRNTIVNLLITLPILLGIILGIRAGIEWFIWDRLPTSLDIEEWGLLFLAPLLFSYMLLGWFLS